MISWLLRHQAQILSEKFSGLPYAICGPVALVYHGHTSSTRQVSILCVESSVDVLKRRASNEDMSMSPRHELEFGVRTTDEEVRCVQITITTEGDFL